MSKRPEMPESQNRYEDAHNRIKPTQQIIRKIIKDEEGRRSEA